MGAPLRAVVRGVARFLANALRRAPNELGFDLGAFSLCVVAAVAAWRKVHDLEWPCENDLYRDLAAAQNVLDGGFGGDPTYLGEHGWYPPLVPTIVALASRLSGVELHRAYTIFGVFLNLLAPLGFYAAGVSLFGRRAALAALVGFLFLGPLDTMSWLSATYSPWLWSQNLAQAFFYFALLSWQRALERPSRKRGLLAGLAVGLTALAHTAPALLLVFLILVGTASELVRERHDRTKQRRLLVLFGAVAGISALVSSPFWFKIVADYHGRVRNSAPFEWLAGELRLEAWRDEFWHPPSFRATLAFVGVAGLWVRGGTTPRARTALIAWGAAATFGIAYGYAVQRFRLPSLLPSWHFYFYLRALESLLFGFGVSLVILGVARLLEKARRLPRDLAERSCVGVVFAALVVLTLTRYRDYRLRRDLVENRRESLRLATLPFTELYEWILVRTEPDDVFLADGDAAFHAVMPAGRKLVRMGELFANPYVGVNPRARDESALYRALEAKRWRSFETLAKKYSVRYVTVPAKDRASYRRGSVPVLRRVHSSSREAGFDVYEVVRRDD